MKYVEDHYFSYYHLNFCVLILNFLNKIASKIAHLKLFTIHVLPVKITSYTFRGNKQKYVSYNND